MGCSPCVCVPNHATRARLWDTKHVIRQAGRANKSEHLFARKLLVHALLSSRAHGQSRSSNSPPPTQAKQSTTLRNAVHGYFVIFPSNAARQVGPTAEEIAQERLGRLQNTYSQVPRFVYHVQAQHVLRGGLLIHCIEENTVLTRLNIRDIYLYRNRRVLRSRRSRRRDWRPSSSRCRNRSVWRGCGRHTARPREPSAAFGRQSSPLATSYNETRWVPVNLHYRSIATKMAK